MAESVYFSTNPAPFNVQGHALYRFRDAHWVVDGHVALQVVASESCYPLLFHGHEIVNLTWVAPWTKGVLASGLIQYIELDASFYATRPYAYIVPFAIIANYGMPLGLVVAPSEREESYRLFDAALRLFKLGNDLVSLKPILSDQGKALISYCKGYEWRHFFCFRHLLELLGSHTYVAMLGRRLLFTSSEREYRELKTITIIDFQIGCEESVINAKGARHFCEFFGLSLNDGHQVTVNTHDPFLAQALWSARGSQGVGTCSNHSEGFHGRANRKVAGVRCLIRRIATIVDLLNKKHDHFALSEINRSAKRVFAQLIDSLPREHADRPNSTGPCPEHCGWDAIYAHRFMIHNFPCKHTILNPDRKIDWNRVGSNFDLGEVESTKGTVVIPYAGRDWPFSLPKGRKTEPFGFEEPIESVAIGDAGTFIERLHAELSASFPHAKLMSKMLLSVEFGRFITTNSPDNMEFRSHFQLKMFRRLSSGLPD